MAKVESDAAGIQHDLAARSVELDELTAQLACSEQQNAEQKTDFQQLKKCLFALNGLLV